MASAASPLAGFHAPVRDWFARAFAAPTRAQRLGWPAVCARQSTLLLAPTGSGKTLAAFLAGLDRLMFGTVPPREGRLRLVYVSPLKALGVDIERNLRAPIAGIVAAAERGGHPCHTPTVAVRSGDTLAQERARFARAPSDILITTPESLYLLLTSQARSTLASVETVIVDEIHALAATKRGAHLCLSLERLEALRPPGAPLQRIGLSATQRPLATIARLLGGGVVTAADWQPRPVTVVDAGEPKSFELSVEVHVDDMARLADEPVLPTGPVAVGPMPGSIWPSIHPRLVELIRAHRSTLLFVNSRRLAERLASAINELAGEELALAHHGSVARERRLFIEDGLKQGRLRAIVATSSLELGIDMGAVELVVQVEAPPSVAAGMQRVGRAGHAVGAVSRGVIFPKYRGDLLAAATTTQRMHAGLVETTHYPENPLDVLAQQLVAMVALEPWDVEALYRTVRGAAPFEKLPRSSFEGVLDMLSGRYPSDEFAGLRARLTWDRALGTLAARRGAQRLAVANGGTIPDRGLYGVFLADAGAERPVRVGELDEEMVFEARAGEVFLLGASSWRIQEITHDRVLVTPAPGEPGKMPFWRGDGPGRAFELGRAMGELTRTLASRPRAAAEALLREQHGLDQRAARNLVAYVADQRAAVGAVPTDRELVIERFVDEVGDQRVCLLSPFGSRVHAPWALAAADQLRALAPGEVDVVWSDDGIVFRLPEADGPPDVEHLLLDPTEVEELVVRALAGTSLFAARFRENAARSLLLPRRRPGQRSPLWAQRRRASDLLQVAAKYSTFPILLETYRECLRETFDLPALIDVLRQVRSRRIRVTTVDSAVPSPFTSSQLFSYLAHFIYDGDAPLAERRAQVLAIDHGQLRELLGEAELRELLHPEVVDAVDLTLRRLGERSVRHLDALHDLLLALGDLTADGVTARCEPASAGATWLAELVSARRAVAVRIAGEARYIAVEDAARYRDALGVVLPVGLPAALLEPVADPLGDLVSRYARTHLPFAEEDIAAHFGLGVATVRLALERLLGAARVLVGEFLPGRRGREWCDAGVLRQLKQRTLAHLRREVEPVEPEAFARFLADWHGLGRSRAGNDALLDAIEGLQGAPIPASVLLGEVLPARVRGFAPAELDLLCAQGEVYWRGVEPLGANDGRIALYFAERYALLAPAARPVDDPLARDVERLLGERGALFYNELVALTGAFGPDLVAALWELVWAGRVTNDTLVPLRALLAPTRGVRAPGRTRARRAGPPGSEGRWARLALASDVAPGGPSTTQRRTAQAEQLLARHGVLTREAVHAEGSPGGFAAVYDVLKAMEEAGRVRRGYFVAGLGATQFARPGAEDRLRAARQPTSAAEVRVLAATDPANPYGAALAWPPVEPRPQRVAGATVFLRDGALVAFLGRTDRSLTTFLPADDPTWGAVGPDLARALGGLVDGVRRRALLIVTVNGEGPGQSPLGPHLVAAGFSPGVKGYLYRGDGARARR